MAYENRTVGYDVVHEYAGRQYSVRLNRDPGTQVPLVIAPEPGLILSAAPPVTVVKPVDHRGRPYRPVY
ncbi:MAG: hypothetical protein MO853_01690 [Candidatus Protistobacter heckmanni]|nr:hypothetical protein [Candidatus Protistobacter heckmanni]